MCHTAVQQYIEVNFGEAKCTIGPPSHPLPSFGNMLKMLAYFCQRRQVGSVDITDDEQYSTMQYSQWKCTFCA